MRRPRYTNAWLLPVLALPLFSSYVSSKDVDPKFTLDFPDERDHNHQDASDMWPLFLQAGWVRVGCYSDNIRSRTLRREIGSVSRLCTFAFERRRVLDIEAMLQTKMIFILWVEQFDRG